MGIVAEFKKFNAELKNSNWSVSSISSNNELIISLWGHKPLLSKHPTERKQIYRDNIDRWSGNGRNELKKNLDLALEEKLNIRPVITMLNNYLDFQQVLTGKDASKYPKRFNAKIDWIGELTIWDGTHFEIVFELEQ
ncbi:MAG: hypothetical protein GAK29_01043 [Acinetobacter bereziniae]|uniref:Uncharacterized protein n=1 Tax=Acinetobacter bereziniae TaxID=106648 RepID=A0A833PIZ4_ACIBZ|nr:MAG: hypothetical protein GAK29_01043 [Acinetobacter bereziniae]